MVHSISLLYITCAKDMIWLNLLRTFVSEKHMSLVSREACRTKLMVLNMKNELVDYFLKGEWLTCYMFKGSG